MLHKFLPWNGNFCIEEKFLSIFFLFSDPYPFYLPYLRIWGWECKVYNLSKPEFQRCNSGSLRWFVSTSISWPSYLIFAHCFFSPVFCGGSKGVLEAPGIHSVRVAPEVDYLRLLVPCVRPWGDLRRSPVQPYTHGGFGKMPKKAIPLVISVLSLPI